MFEKEAEEQAFKKYPIPRAYNDLGFTRNCNYKKGCLKHKLQEN